ncbi:MAG: replicative DNA helicase [Burkholderiales bacterium]|jgi:replicative DNA helicase|nr:replicative DNA helicase [Burkholderiales bacterium]
MWTDNMTNNAAEQTVIGALLIDSEAFDRIEDRVSIDDFSVEDHRALFAEIRAMIAAGQPVDVVTLAESLHGKGRLDSVGGLVYIGALAQNVPTAANVGHYADIVRAKAVRRRLARAGEKIAELAHSAESSDNLIDEARRLIDGAADEQAGDGAVMLGDMLGGFLDDIEARMESGGELPGLPTGLTDLDEKLLGLRGGDLVIVAGRPSMGKTTLAMGIGLHNAVAGHPVFVASLEMTGKALLERAVASLGRVDSRKLRNGALGGSDSQEWDGVTVAAEKLKNIKLAVDGSARLTVERLRARAKRMKARHGLALIIIDYIQLMDAEGQSRNEQISAISRGLKLLAMELDVPVIALSQLSRQCDGRTDKRPMLSDLRDSGAIEQDADVVVMVYRDEVYNSATDAKGIAEINVGKNREGETGRVYATFLGHINRFENSLYRPPAKTETTAKRGFCG